MPSLISTIRARAWAGVAASGALLAIVRIEGLADPNVLWGTRSGQEMISSGHLPHHDMWSWTVAGKTWVPNSWGWDLLLGAVHNAGGSALLAAINTALIGFLVLALAWLAFRLGATPLAVLASVGAIGAPVFMPWVIARAQLASYCLVLVVVHLVRPTVLGSRRRCGLSLAVLAVVQVVWINLHLFAIIGPALIAVAGAGHLAERHLHRVTDAVSLREQAARLGAAVVVAAAACAITPYGPVAAAKAIAVRQQAAGLIVEWRPAGFGTYSQFTAVVAILAGVVAVAHARRLRRWDMVAVIAVLAIGSAIGCRMAPVAAVFALPYFAAALSGWLQHRAVRVVTGVTVAVVALLGVGIAVSGLGNIGRLDTPNLSPSLLGRLPHDCRLVNDYGLGGAVIYFRRDVKVSVDSRTDLYGRDRILANQDLLQNKPGSLERVDTAGVTCVLAPSDSKLVATLKTSGHWRKVASDNQRTLLVRN